MKTANNEVREQLEQLNIEFNHLCDMINDLLWDFENGHINAYKLVKQIKELTQ